jgi:hypothetical protein
MLRNLALEIARLEVKRKTSNMRGEVLIKLVVDSLSYLSEG